MLKYAGRALGLTLLVAAAWAMIQAPAATQGRPNYRVDPWWPRPFTNQSWVLGSITGVTVDAQNHVWVVHRGGDSLEANEKGMMLTPPSASLCCQSAPQVLEFDQKGVAGVQLGWSGRGLRLAAAAGQHRGGRQRQRLDCRRGVRDRPRHPGEGSRRRRRG